MILSKDGNHPRFKESLNVGSDQGKGKLSLSVADEMTMLRSRAADYAKLHTKDGTLRRFTEDMEPVECEPYKLGPINLLGDNKSVTFTAKNPLTSSEVFTTPINSVVSSSRSCEGRIPTSFAHLHRSERRRFLHQATSEGTVPAYATIPYEQLVGLHRLRRLTSSPFSYMLGISILYRLSIYCRYVLIGNVDSRVAAVHVAHTLP